MEYLSKIVYKTIFRKYGLRRGLDLNKYPNIYDYINNLFDDSYSFDESLKRYFLYYSNKFNNEELKIILYKPKCKTCKYCYDLMYCKKNGKILTDSKVTTK